MAITLVSGLRDFAIALLRMLATMKILMVKRGRH
jgi:hypothetical protein